MGGPRVGAAGAAASFINPTRPHRNRMRTLASYRTKWQANGQANGQWAGQWTATEKRKAFIFSSRNGMSQAGSGTAAAKALYTADTVRVLDVCTRAIALASVSPCECFVDSAAPARPGPLALHATRMPRRGGRPRVGPRRNVHV